MHYLKNKSLNPFWGLLVALIFLPLQVMAEGVIVSEKKAPASEASSDQKAILNTESLRQQAVEQSEFAPVVNWTQQQQVNQVLDDISELYLNVGDSSTVNQDQQGFTIQLASFRKNWRMVRFLEELKYDGELFVHRRDDGWISVTTGFYPEYSKLQQHMPALKKLAKDSWIKQVKRSELTDPVVY